MKTLFVATLGNRDLQLILENADSVSRIEIKKDEQFIVNNYLLEHVDELEYWNSPEYPRLSDVPATQYVSRNEKIKIFPGLLAEVFNKIEAEFKCKPTVVILLNTDRKKHNEPFSYGEIISRWVAKILEMNYIGQITSIPWKENSYTGYFNYLSNDETITQWACTENNMLFKKIERIFSNLSRTGGFDRIIISTAGGIPQANEVVRAAAEYYFLKTPLFEIVRDEIKERAEISNKKNVLSLQRELEIKKHVETLIENSDFHGAFAAASVWYDDEKNFPGWLKQLDNLQQFFSGSDISNKVSGALEELSKIMPPAYISLNADIAIKQNQIYRALALTSTFMDSLLIQFIDLVQGFKVNVLQKSIKVDPKIKIPDILTNIRNEKYYCMTKSGMPDLYYYRNDRGDFNYWISGLKQLLPEKQKGLTILSQIFDVVSNGKGFPLIIEDESRNNPYGIRNLYNHYGVLQMHPDNSKMIKEYMTQNKIWNTHESNPFMSAFLVNEALQEIGSGKVLEIYNSTVRKILENMRTSK